MLTAIELEWRHPRATIVLSAPAGKPPTLDHSSLASLERVIGELKAARPRVVVVRSNTPKYFCVGANLQALEKITPETIGAWVELGHRVFNALADLPCPVVAHVSGYAMGGGLELAMSCDAIFASADARFAQSEATLGFIPGWGATFRLVERVGVAQAKRLFFTGALLDADAAQKIGLVDEVVAPEKLEAAIDAFAAAVVANNENALATFKRIVDGERARARERGLAAESMLSSDCCADPDAKERLQRFLTKRR